MYATPFFLLATPEQHNKMAVVYLCNQVTHSCGNWCVCLHPGALGVLVDTQLLQIS